MGPRSAIILLCLSLAAGLPSPAIAQDDPAADKVLAEVDAAVRRHKYEVAVTLLSDLSDAGNAEARYRLANFYRTGRGVPPDDKKAFDLIQAAAEQGHVEAQFSLGNLYLSGRGTPTDAQRGQFWIRAAAQAGHARAVDLLGRLGTVEPAAPAVAATIPEQKAQPTVSSSDLSRALGWTPLMEASRRGEADLVAALLKSGAVPGVADTTGRTAMLHAAEAGQAAVVRLLYSAGADVNATASGGETALALASAAGNLDTVQ